jgi:hypothetical protein
LVRPDFIGIGGIADSRSSCSQLTYLSRIRHFSHLSIIDTGGQGAHVPNFLDTWSSIFFHPNVNLVFAQVPALHHVHDMTGQ